MRLDQDGAPGPFRVSPHAPLAIIGQTATIRRPVMSLFDTVRDRLAERRERRRRYTQHLEILSLPPEIQKDIQRPEDEESPAGAPSPAAHLDIRDIAA
ncbi:MAG: hypothetical protein ACXIVF_02995 [Rhizobiaceae bacterium]